MTPAARILTALQLLKADPVGLGGLVLRARVGPARDAVLALARDVFPAQVRLHAQMTREDLEGGLDLAATLGSGALVEHRGVLKRGACHVIPMAERVLPQMAATLATVLDRAEFGPFIALDEGAEEDEALPPALADRLALQLDVSELRLADLAELSLPAAVPLSKVGIPEDLPEQLVVLTSQLGISSLRAPSFALRAAKAHAAFSGRDRVCSDDVTAAVELVYAHRATRLPEEAPPEDDTQPEDQTDPSETQSQELTIPDELLIEAIKAALPADLLAKLQSGAARNAKGSGSGKRKTGNRRGRPLPSTGTRARAGQRIDLMATLRAAIPWQTLRKQQNPDRTGAIVLAEDLRAKRYQELSDRLLIFTVDASGSAALARLGEAKGAVELLLADAYARRDHVALIAFRGEGAEVLLPPTRSLVQTKRRLAELPGGGGTPTASGLASALELALSAERKGLTPTVILLTDGRSNVALDGTPNRGQAAQDASELARQLAAKGVDGLVIDTGNRPERALADLARDMRAPYLALPRADARKLSAAVTDSLGS
jgi:magnesium chelatase subunit D